MLVEQIALVTLITILKTIQKNVKIKHVNEMNDITLIPDLLLKSTDL